MSTCDTGYDAHGYGALAVRDNPEKILDCGCEVSVYEDDVYWRDGSSACKFCAEEDADSAHVDIRIERAGWIRI